MSEYKLIRTSQTNGFTVKNFIPVLSEDERKTVISEITTNLLNEYNRLETEKRAAAV